MRPVIDGALTRPVIDEALTVPVMPGAVTKPMIETVVFVGTTGISRNQLNSQLVPQDPPHVSNVAMEAL